MFDLILSNISISLHVSNLCKLEIIAPKPLYAAICNISTLVLGVNVVNGSIFCMLSINDGKTIRIPSKFISNSE